METNHDVYTITLDDDPMVAEIIEKASKIKTKCFTDPTALIREVENLRPIAAFVDIDLGGSLSGLDIIPALRNAWPFCPILVVTAAPTESTIMEALNAGADDFVRKPLIVPELNARLKTRIEDSSQKSASSVVQFGDIEINTVQRYVEGPKGKRYASPIEISVLTCLAHTKGGIVGKDKLKVQCWGQAKVSDNAFHRKLYAVRQLLSDVTDGVAIQTKYGVGFGLKEVMMASFRKAS